MTEGVEVKKYRKKCDAISEWPLILIDILMSQILSLHITFHVYSFSCSFRFLLILYSSSSLLSLLLLLDCMMPFATHMHVNRVACVSMFVCASLRLCVVTGHMVELRKNGRNNRDALWGRYPWSKKPRRGPDRYGKRHFGGIFAGPLHRTVEDELVRYALFACSAPILRDDS